MAIAPVKKADPSKFKVPTPTKDATGKMQILMYAQWPGYKINNIVPEQWEYRTGPNGRQMRHITQEGKFLPFVNGCAVFPSKYIFEVRKKMYYGYQFIAVHIPADIEVPKDEAAEGVTLESLRAESLSHMLENEPNRARAWISEMARNLAKSQDLNFSASELEQAGQQLNGMVTKIAAADQARAEMEAEKKQLVKK